ncbi:MAG: arsenite methyltransferase [bacterium]|nr:arsenite methyltransferase [bacterium]
MSDQKITEEVRRRYGEAAKAVAGGRRAGCCGDDGSCGATVDPITSDLYDLSTQDELPDEAVLASLGCGNPTALAELTPGEDVLDLGSGGGIDVLLSARRVGPDGRVYGLDMTDEMLALARENQRRAGAENVEFLKGSIEAVPLPDGAVDVIISNCVINLSTDKDAVFREAARVLRPGGRFAVSDMVLTRPLPPELADIVNLWTGCVAGALVMDDYRRGLEEAGFVDVEFEVTRTFSGDDLAEMAGAAGDRLANLDGTLVSAFVRARRPDRREPPA